VTERNSSRTEKELPPPVDDSHEEEKMLGPKALDKLFVGSVVSEPDRRRLFRSVIAGEATEEAMEAEWRKLGRIGAADAVLCV
jgi:hypothetical protein